MDEPHPFDPDDLPDDLRGRIKAELVPGERLLWAARALPRPPGSPGGYVVAGLIAVSALAVCGTASFAYFGPPGDPNTRYGGLVFLALVSGFTGLFIAMGMVAFWWSGLVAIRETEFILYALTDRRAIIWRPSERAGAVAVHSIDPRMVSTIHRVENSDGSGDVLFSGPNLGPYLDPRGFEGVAEVRRVEALARRTLTDPETTLG